MLFHGNPGTGKTSVARLFQRYLRAFGVLARDRFVEVNALELKGQYSGQTGPVVKEHIANALGGALFIDEAYALTPWTDGKLEGYGAEAVTALVEFMSRYKGLYCVMVAGYEREMVRYFLTANPGLPRRLPFRYVLRPLSVDDLVGVFQRHMLLEQGLEVPTGRVRRVDAAPEPAVAHARLPERHAGNRRGRRRRFLRGRRRRRVGDDARGDASATTGPSMPESASTARATAWSQSVAANCPPSLTSGASIRSPRFIHRYAWRP